MLFERKYYTYCTDKHDNDTPTPRVREYLDTFLLNAELYTTEDFIKRRNNLFQILTYFKLVFTLTEDYGNLNYTKKIEERLRYNEKRRMY